jgi:hypothetical protein
MNWSEITVDTLKANRPDLLPVLQESIETSAAAKKAAADAAATLKTLQEENATLKAEKQTRVLQEAIEGELKAAKIDPADKVACSPAFRKTLQEAKDAEARKLLIEDRTTILSRVPPARSYGPVTTGTPHPLQEDSTGAILPKTAPLAQRIARFAQ